MNSVKKRKVFDLFNILEKPLKEDLDAKRYELRSLALSSNNSNIVKISYLELDAHDIEIKIWTVKYIKSRLEKTKHLKNKVIFRCLDEIEKKFIEEKKKNWNDSDLKLKILETIYFEFKKILCDLSDQHFV